METIDKQSSPAGVVSYAEERAWNEFVADRETFFHRGELISVPLPSGAGRAEAAQLIEAVSARHEILRTAYDTTAGVPKRHVLPHYDHPVMEADAMVYPLMGKHDTHLMPEDLVRVWLVPGPDGGKQLGVDLNEIVTDAWSCARLREEIVALVDDAARGANAPANGAGGYGAYAAEEREQQLPAKTIDYWTRQLTDFADACSYMTPDGPDPSGDAAGERVLVFRDDQTEAMRTICKRYRVSPFMAVSALVSLAFATLSDSRDIAVVTSASMRTPKWNDVQGNFSNLMIVRTVLRDAPTVKDAFAATRRSVVEALAHQPMPFLRLAEMSGDVAPKPPVRVHFLPAKVHHYSGVLDAKPSGAAWKEDAMFAGWPLDMGFAEDQRGRVAIWSSYDPRVFRHDTVSRVIERCSEVLEVVAGDSDLALDEVAGRLGS